MYRFISFIGFLLLCGLAMSQDPVYEKQFEEQYERNIKKERINGFYIPVDLQDAFDELERKSEPGALVNFKNAPEDTIRRKLHFGLGRWISSHWNFYEGSRFSHHLKEMGLDHPDDMTQFVIVSFHRNLNGQPLEVKQQIKSFQDFRKELMESRKASSEIIKEETRIRKKNGGNK